MTPGKIREILDTVQIGQTGWEGNEDVMVFNHEPIGATISRRSLEIDRWWPAMKDRLAKLVADASAIEAAMARKQLATMSGAVTDLRILCHRLARLDDRDQRIRLDMRTEAIAGEVDLASSPLRDNGT